MLEKNGKGSKRRKLVSGGKEDGGARFREDNKKEVEKKLQENSWKKGEKGKEQVRAWTRQKSQSRSPGRAPASMGVKERKLLKIIGKSAELDPMLRRGRTSEERDIEEEGEPPEGRWRSESCVREKKRKRENQSRSIGKGQSERGLESKRWWKRKGQWITG